MGSENDHVVEHVKIRALRMRRVVFRRLSPCPIVNLFKIWACGIVAFCSGETSGYLDLKVLSIARLMLDNVPTSEFMERRQVLNLLKPPILWCR